MFCAYCGASINDDAVFCPSCGKSTKPEVTGYIPPQTENVQRPNQTVVFAQNIYPSGNNVHKRNYPLINFSAKAFYPFLEFSMWLTLVVGAITGGVIASYYGNAFEVIIGVIVGVIIMFFWIINLGGLIAIFLKVKEGIEEINRKTKDV
jgi:hypothetical protein